MIRAENAVYSSVFDSLDSPSSDFVERTETRFPTERELNRIRALRVRGRPGEPYHRISLDDFTMHLRQMLDAELDSDYELTDARWLTGGASKIQMAFQLAWTDPERGAVVDHLVVRMEPAESLNATSRLREFELLRLVRDTLPVPRTLWVDPDGKWFPEPALVYAYAHGITKPPTTTTGKISGLGTDFGPKLRDVLGEQFLSHLATIHTYQVPEAALPSFDRPRIGETDAARWLLDRARRVWEEDRGEDFPLMEVAANWLERNLPTLDHLSIVHGDYRSGNFLYDPETNEISAWLDWERAHLGDRHVDLAWATQPTFGHMNEAGDELIASGLVPLHEFYERYEAKSGLSVDPKRLTYFRILNCYQIVVTVLATAHRVVRLQRSHQDIVLARVRAVLPGLYTELRQLLEEEM